MLMPVLQTETQLVSAMHLNGVRLSSHDTCPKDAGAIHKNVLEGKSSRNYALCTCPRTGSVILVEVRSVLLVQCNCGI
jgi:hypothetical protein